MGATELANELHAELDVAGTLKIGTGIAALSRSVSTGSVLQRARGRGKYISFTCSCRSKRFLGRPKQRFSVDL